MANSHSGTIGSATATAGRLRLVQAEFADHAPEERRQLLGDELHRALAAVPPDDRPAFLARLQDLFPTWDSRVDVAPQAQLQPAPARSATDLRELRDPSFLVSRLIELAPKLSAGERAALIDRIEEAGLSRGGGGELPAAAVKLLRDQLKLDGKAASLSAGRVAELCTVLAKFAGELDPVIWNLWRQVAPKSTLRRQGDLGRTMPKFATGDENISRAQVQQELEALRSLVSAVIQAMGQVQKALPQRLRKFTPSAIEAVARQEKRTLESIEAASWRKYKELSSELEQDALEAAIRQAIAEQTEAYLGRR